MQKVSTLVSKDISNYLTNRATWNIFYNAKAEGLAGDGTTDDYADLSTLINTTINGAEATIIFSPGTYKISTNITIPSNVNLFLTKGAMLSPDSVVTVTINGPVEAGLWQIFTGSGTISGSMDVDIVYPQWFGAVGDGVADDTVPIQAAATACKNGTNASIAKLLIVDGVYRITSPIDFRYIQFIDCRGTLSLEFDDQVYGVLIGNSSGSTRSVNIFISRVNSLTTSPVMPGIRVVGLKNAFVHVGYSDFMQLYADSDSATTDSIAYSQFMSGKVTKLEFNTNPSPVGSTTQWINENTFWGGRINRIIMSGTYQHNNNKFIRPTIESGEITLNVGSTNVFEGLRFEGSVDITFANGTWGNVVEQQWISNPSSSISAGFGAVSYNSLTDDGVNNTVYRTPTALMDTYQVFKLDKNTPGINGSVALTESRPYGQGSFGMDRYVPGFDKIKFGPTRSLFITDFIEIGVDDFLVHFKSDATVYRPRIYVYDENKAQITGSTDPATIGSGSISWQSSDNRYSTTTSRSSDNAVVKHNSNGRYIKIEIIVFESTYFKYISLFIRGVNTYKIYNQFNSNPAPLIASAAITKGYFPKGMIISRSDTTGYYQNTFDLLTTLSSGASATDTTIDVTSATGVTSGDIIGILLDDGSTQWTTVNGAPSGTTITITDALTGNTASGNSVGFNRWV